MMMIPRKCIPSDYLTRLKISLKNRQKHQRKLASTTTAV